MNDTIGKKIAKLRREAKLTQEELAQKLFVTDGTVSKWETGKSVPDYETLKTISKIFDVKINYFLEDTSIKGHLKRFINAIFHFINNHWSMIIQIIITLFLLLYFVITFNSYQMYEIKIEEQDVISFDTGYYIKSNSKIVLNITNIKIMLEEDNILNQTIRLYTFVNDEKTYFYESSNLDNIMIKQFNGYEEYFNKKLVKTIPKYTYIELEVLHDDNTISHYNTKLTMQKVVDSKWLLHRNKIVKGNNKIINQTKKTKEEQANILFNKHFENIKDTSIYYKKINNYFLYFDLSDNKMFYDLVGEGKTERIFYYYENDFLNYTCQNEDTNSNMIKEKFLYKNKEHIIQCDIGNCDNYKEIYIKTIGIYNSIFS